MKTCINRPAAAGVWQSSIHFKNVYSVFSSSSQEVLRNKLYKTDFASLFLSCPKQNNLGRLRVHLVFPESERGRLTTWAL